MVGNTTVLFINHGLGTRCGVYDIGRRLFNALHGKTTVDLVYCDVNSMDEYASIMGTRHFDVVVFNYLTVVMPWLTSEITEWPGSRVVIGHLYHHIGVSAALDSFGGMFDYMLCMDPCLLASDSRILTIGRPLLDIGGVAEPAHHIPHIGSFGFAAPYKRFPLVMHEINRCFDRAVFCLHMTDGDFTDGNSSSVYHDVLSEITKPGISVQWESSYLPEEDVVRSLSMNHFNTILYDLPPGGRSSALDYLVAAQRPILMTDNLSLNHVAGTSIGVYPDTSFSDMMVDLSSRSGAARGLVIDASARLVVDFERAMETVS